jgi:hypothetical protein
VKGDALTERFVTTPYVYVDVALETVICAIKIGDSPKKRAWYTCEWMEPQAVDTDAENLDYTHIGLVRVLAGTSKEFLRGLGGHWT